jgi:hypothetical protein
MKKLPIFAYIFITFLASCQKEIKKYDTTNKNINSRNTEINILKTQLKKGLKATIGDAVDYQIEYSNDDIKIEEQLLKDILEQQGFKNLNNKDFSDKIKLIFSRDLDYSSNKDLIYINNLNRCLRDAIYFKNNFLDYDGFFIYKQNNFIAPLLTVPELIDYQKKYPEIVEYEKTLPTEYLDNNGDKIKIKKWQNENNLSQQRYNTIQTIVARNKYLFNDSKADFTWLKFNDKTFLESLVKIHGYYNDLELNRFVLDRNISDLEELGKILWIKKCDNKFIINQKLFDIISTSTEENKRNYLNSISEYLATEVKSKNSELNNNFSKKVEILGKIAYYSSKVGKSNNFYYQFFSTFNGYQNYEDEFKKANYYNIPDFKKVWEETRTGGVSYPGME